MANHRKRQSIFSSNFTKTANAAIAGIKRAPDELDTVFGPTATNLTPDQNTAVTAHSVRMDRSVDQQVQNLIANNDGDLNKLSDDFDEQSKALFDTLPDPLKPGAQQQIGEKNNRCSTKFNRNSTPNKSTATTPISKPGWNYIHPTLYRLMHPTMMRSRTPINLSPPLTVAMIYPTQTNQNRLRIYKTVWLSALYPKVLIKNSRQMAQPVRVRF